MSRTPDLTKHVDTGGTGGTLFMNLVGIKGLEPLSPRPKRGAKPNSAIPR